jgi:hypothetical protein
MTRRALRVVLLVLSYGATACTSAADPSPRAEIVDSVGVRIVHSGNPRWTENQRWSVPPEPDVVIGVLNGPEEYQFVEIADAARRSDGSSVVVDRGARIVRLYDLNGEYQMMLGGPGAGPGEFTDPVSVLVTVGDTVVIWDQALLRATRFAPSGNLVAVQTVDWGQIANRLDLGMMSKGGTSGLKGPDPPSGLYPGPMEPMADGGLLVRLVDKSGVTPPSGFFRPPSGVLRVSDDLSVIDTLMFFGDTEQVVVDAPWGPFSVAPPGGMRTQIAHHGNPPHTCIGDQEEPEILCLTPGEGPIALRWDPKLLPFTEDDVAAWRESTVRFLDAKLDRDQVLEMLDEVPVPRFRPPYGRILFDRAGHLWAERGPARGEYGDSTDFFVFDTHGVLLGVVNVPSIRILDIGLDYVLGVHEDALGIQYVRIYELRKDR